MLRGPFENALVLTGPTGAGKTDLAIDLAERLDAEIVSMDSMALYRGMDIGTAKPGPEQRRRVPHHLIDVREPWESASVAWWLQEAARACRAIEADGKRVLFVGGTPLYLKALIYGLFEGPAGDPVLRARLESEATEAGCRALYDRLAGVDPAAAARLHPNDLRRIVRALEVWEVTGRPISAWQTQWPAKREATGEGRGAGEGGTPGVASSRDGTMRERIICLDWPRAELYARIDARAQDMVRRGLVEEVRTLCRQPRPLSLQARQALGYREALEFLDGGLTLAEMISRIQIRSRHFAKRQLSWFRHLPGCARVNPNSFSYWGLTIG